LGCCRQEYWSRRNPLRQPVSFIGTKNESLVFLDRPAQGRTELVLLVVRNSGVEESLRVQNLIPKEFVNITVNVVGPGLCDHIDYRSGVAAVFCVKRIGQYEELFNRIRRRLNRRRI